MRQSLAEGVQLATVGGSVANTQKKIKKWQWIRMSQMSILAFKSRENHVSCRALQSYNSPGDWARELFKPSTDSASLVAEIEKNIFVFSGGFSGGNATSGGVFGYLYLALGSYPLGHYYGSRFCRKLGQNPRLQSPWMTSSISVAEIMAKNKIGENVCNHKPQFGLEHTPFRNGHHSPADRAREPFKSLLNGERRVV